MHGLRPLPDGIRQLVAPVFDVAAPTKSADQAKALKFVANNIAGMAKVAAGFAGAFVDSSELDPAFRLDGPVHPLVAAGTALKASGVQVVPVTGLHRDPGHQEAALELRDGDPHKRICLRLDATDVGTATFTHKAVIGLLAANGIASEQTFLLIDLQCVHGQDVNAVAALVQRFLALLEANLWAGIVVGGYGFPEQISTAVSTNSQTYLKRTELEIFQKLVKSRSPLWFADYTVVSPAVVELDWRLIAKVMTPKAIYTLDDSWFVVRGGTFSAHGYEQYYAIADEIVALEEFSGADFSAGDQYICDRAQRSTKPGNPGGWITACVTHHITLTAQAQA